MSDSNQKHLSRHLYLVYEGSNKADAKKNAEEFLKATYGVKEAEGATASSVNYSYTLDLEIKNSDGNKSKEARKH